jgi:hypothetical protein
LPDQNQSTSDSPWDEVLEEVHEEPKKPTVFGTLEPAADSSGPKTSSGQFSVPGEIPEGVGSKIPANQISTDQKQPPVRLEVESTPPPTIPVETQPVTQPKIEPKTAEASPLPIDQTQKQPQSAKTEVKTSPKTEAKPQKQPPRPPLDIVGRIRGIFLSPRSLIIETIVILLFGLTYFNESGILATGFEKVYGIFHLEALWGGLPADPQLALGQSFLKMKDEESFKIDSEMKITVNRNTESNITSPLFSFDQRSFIFALEKAVFVASESETSQELSGYDAISSTAPAYDNSWVDDLYNDSQTSSDSTSTDTTTDDVADSTETESQAPAEPEISQDQQSSTATEAETEPTIKEFSIVTDGYLGINGGRADFEITDESTKKSGLSLISNDSKLYFQSSKVDFFGSASNWVYAKLPTVHGEVFPEVFSDLNFEGFSVTGKRLGSGKINQIPVYRYQVNIKIGSIFENIGITDEMVNSITGEIDIGKKDQLVHYVELTIIPSINSSVSRIDLKSALNDYGQIETLSVPSSVAEAEIAGVDTSDVAETDDDSTPPSTTKYSAELLARDTQRKADLRSIQSALAEYYSKFGYYPSTSDKLIETRTRNNILTKALIPDFLSALPVDPWTDKYYYGYKSNGTAYELSAVLGNNEDAEGTKIGEINLFIIKN